MKRINLINRRVGKLTVIRESRTCKKHTYWYCQCDCGNFTEVCGGHLLAQRIKSCGCLIRRIGKDHPNWNGCGEINGALWRMLLQNAKNRKIEVTINIQYLWDLFIKQDRKCALTGMKIFLPEKSGSPHTASVDRIDSSKGYINGNIQWLHKDINQMKNTFKEDHFIDMCKKVSFYRKIDTCLLK